MVQKKAFAVILGTAYVSYESALLVLEQERLDVRRLDLSFKFASKYTPPCSPQPELQAQHETTKAVHGTSLPHLKILPQPYPFPCKAPEQAL